MQQLKELLAWGGVDHSQNSTQFNPDNLWDVDERLVNFITDAYVRGWAMSAKTVDLDSGTALFPLRVDAKRWNDSISSVWRDSTVLPWKPWMCTVAIRKKHWAHPMHKKLKRPSTAIERRLCSVSAPAKSTGCV